VDVAGDDTGLAGTARAPVVEASRRSADGRFVMEAEETHMNDTRRIIDAWMLSYER